MFGNLGFGELMVIMVIVLVLFGAKRVPEISASFGKGIREFKRNLNDIEHTVTSSVTADVPRAHVPQLERPLESGAADGASDAPTPDDTLREPKRLL
jgi:sec-independent protein translocase protein TatA